MIELATWLDRERVWLYAHVQELEPRAVYAHCYSHALDLAASNMLKQCALLKDAISTSHKPIKTYKIIHPEENA